MSAFFAYPSGPAELVAPIRSGLELLARRSGSPTVRSWEENEIAGRFIQEPIAEQILAHTHFIADISFYNFNVFYEIGFAIANDRRIVLTRNTALKGDRAGQRFPLLDTVGHLGYRNSSELADALGTLPESKRLLVRNIQKDDHQPVYYLRTPSPVDFDIRTISRLKKARLGFRIYDPEETGPLTAADAIDNCSQSHGLVLHLLPSTFTGSQDHNLCMAFTAGLGHGFGIKTILLQTGNDPVPLDYRDLVTTWQKPEQIEQIIGEFAPEIYELARQATSLPAAAPVTGIEKVSLGSPSAENEFGELGHYFLETDEYRRIIRGEVHVAAGRKGSGKTALFAQARNWVRRNRKNIVLDLQPEGSQLLKIKDLMLSMLGKGTKEHTVVAFWEYLLLLEICHKVLHKDHQVHLTNHQLYAPYRELEAVYGASGSMREGDFAERMLALVDSITESFSTLLDSESGEVTLSRESITQLLHKHDIHELRSKLVDYLGFKEEVWILFDNLDKGWSAYGVEPDDVLLLRCLQDALVKLRQDFERYRITCRSTLFLRNDILSLMVDQTPDRGKIAIVPIDWDDPDMLRELLRRRLQHSMEAPGAAFEEMWSLICVSHYKNEESSQYLIDRSLMRPRALIDIVQRCVSHAINVGHSLVEAEDIYHGEHSYSAHLVDQIGYEIRDVMVGTDDLLYMFIGARDLLSYAELIGHVEALPDNVDRDRVVELLLWYGVVGIVKPDTNEPVYIFNVRYDIKRMKALVDRYAAQSYFCFNPAFHLGLDITH